jgi:hypothetical protein
MAKKSLPEHTLDMWVACAIAEAFTGAHIWAPTQNDTPGNWDLATQPAGSKTVILENKATAPNGDGSHRIEIGVAQLKRYSQLPPLDFDRLFYVLPGTPWQGDHAPGPVPGQAAERMGIHGWAYVLPSHCLWHWLLTQGRKSVNTEQLPGEAHTIERPELKCPTCRRSPWTLQHFFDGLRGCTIGERNPEGSGGAGGREDRSGWDAGDAARHREQEKELIRKWEKVSERKLKGPMAITLLAVTILAGELTGD